MNKIKSLFSILLTAVLLISMLSSVAISVSADESYTLDIYFNVNGGKLFSDSYAVDKDNNVINKNTQKCIIQTMTYDNPAKNGLWNASSFGLEKEGYKFVGWSTEDNTEVVFDQDDVTLRPSQIDPEVQYGNRTIVLYAVWAPFYTIKYRGNGGNGYMPDDAVIGNSMFTFDKNIFKNEGHTFLGWCAYRESDKKWFVKGAGWVTQSVINANGYEKKLYEDNLTLKMDNSWYNPSTGSAGDTIAFYAVWELNTLDIYFSADGAEVNSSEFTMTSNSIIAYKNTGKSVVQTMTYDNTSKNGLWNASSFGLEKPGHRFVGWSAKDGSDIIFDQDDVSLTPSQIYPDIKNTSAQITLYPVWERLDFSIAPARDGVVIDSENGLIYGLSEGIQSLNRYVTCRNCSLEYTETEWGFGTGTRVDVIVEGKVGESYEIVIFGDVIGDGYVDIFDVADITSVINWEKEYEAGSAYEKAADANRDGVVDETDVFLIDIAASFIDVLPQV